MINDKTIRILMLHDSQGKMLVLLPHAQLLNLVGVWKETGRQLQPLSANDSIKFFSQSGLDSKSGLSALFSTPTLIDHSCPSAGILNLIEPNSGREFQVDCSSVDNEAQRGTFGVTIDEIDNKQPEGDDVTVITKAVEKFTALRIKQRLEDTLGLPTLPPTSQKILQLRTSPSAGVDDLIPIVKMDPSLSAQVMSWAASPYYAAPGTIRSVQDAIVRVLGYDLVVNLALGIAMGNTLALPNNTPRGATPYWLQSVYCATLSEQLAKKIPAESRPHPGLAYLSGLLHNFGYLALAHIFPPHFALVSRYVEANPHLHHEYIEKQIINVTREQVGAWLMETWNLPPEVYRAIRYQNDLTYNDEHCEYAMLTNLSLRLLRKNGIGDGPTGDIPEIFSQKLGLTAKDMEEAFEKVHHKEDDLTEMTRVLKAS